MTKVTWRDYRKKVNYVTIQAVKELICNRGKRFTGYTPTFTLHEEDEDGCYSLPKLFLEYCYDPTEKEFVDNVFDGDFRHWDKFRNNVFIRKYYEDWKARAERKLLSEVMLKMVEMAFDNSNKSSFSALKYLADRGFKEEKQAVGRPKKEKTPEKVDDKDLLADIARLKGED